MADDMPPVILREAPGTARRRLWPERFQHGQRGAGIVMEPAEASTQEVIQRVTFWFKRGTRIAILGRLRSERSRRKFVLTRHIAIFSWWLATRLLHVPKWWQATLDVPRWQQQSGPARCTTTGQALDPHPGISRRRPK